MTEVKMFCSYGDKKYETKSFGLYYEIFKSIYIYGTEEDIERYKRLVSQIGIMRAANALHPTSKDIEKAKTEAIAEMKRIGTLYGLDIKENDYDMIRKRWFDHSDYFVGVKYFDKYLEGRILHNKLDELEVD